MQRSGVSSTSSVVLATRSAGKQRELVPYFASFGVRVDTLADLGVRASAHEETLEVFATFEANALAKARWFHDIVGDRVIVADDSGLAVDALSGAPGVLSKRWSGRSDLDGAALDAANNAQLQAQLAAAAAVGQLSRRAQYVCAAACVWNGGELVVRAVTLGSLCAQSRGTGGFGYDPYFVSDDLGITFAEATLDAKARVSHRGRAFARLIDGLQQCGVLTKKDAENTLLPR
jgi:XTP/dITP diphosphohydrolase